MALMTQLTVPTFLANTLGNQSLIFVDDLFVYLTEGGFSETDVLRRVLLVALRGAVKRRRCFQPPFQSKNQFIAAFREKFLLVAYDYLIWRENQCLNATSKEGSGSYVRAAQEHFRRVYPTAPETIKVLHVMRRCHPHF